jgi:hypothetical protein
MVGCTFLCEHHLDHQFELATACRLLLKVSALVWTDPDEDWWKKSSFKGETGSCSEIGIEAALEGGGHAWFLLAVRLSLVGLPAALLMANQEL